MLWKRLEVVEDPPWYIEVDNDRCFYARDYVSEGGYAASRANQLIINFKIPPAKRNAARWRYKSSAIKQFALELSHILPENAVISGIPTSRIPDSSDYDSRLEDTLQLVQERCSTIRLEQPLEMSESILSAHEGGARDPDIIRQFLIWNGFSEPTDHLILIDDVITTGGHFKACKAVILEHHPNVEVIGVFWSRTVWPADSDLTGI